MRQEIYTILGNLTQKLEELTSVNDEKEKVEIP
jgi:hypothetical protein